MYVFIVENTPLMWSIKIGQTSCVFCSNGTLSVKSNKTGKKQIPQEIISAETGVFIFALRNSVMIVNATIPQIFNATEHKNICKKFRLYVDEV